MDALLTALVACLLCEVGARTQINAHALAKGGVSEGLSLGALGLILAISLIIAAIGGLLVRPVMNPEAQTLLLGLALIFAGGGQLLRLKTPSTDAEASLAKILASYLMAHFRDGTPFLAFAIVAKTGQPILTAIGTVAAVFAVAGPAALLPKEWERPALFSRLRRIAAAMLILAGIWNALVALRLI